jgi:hypothetical protein
VGTKHRADQHKTGQQQIDANQKQRQALELRRAGVTYEVIARQLGYADRTGAYRAVRTALAQNIKEPADDVRALELERLDALLRGVWVPATQGNVQALDRVLKIMDRRAALLGLDEPVKIDLRPFILAEAQRMGLDEAEAVAAAEAIIGGRL